MAAEIRCLRALLSGGRGAVPGPRRPAARTRPSRPRRIPTLSPRSVTSRASRSSPTTSPAPAIILPPADGRADGGGWQGRNPAAFAAAALRPVRRLSEPDNGKADAQIICIDPTLAAHPNVTLLRNAYAERLLTDAGGGRITGVEVTIEGEAIRSAPTVRGRLRRAVVGTAVPAFGQRPASGRARQPLGPSRAQLHAPQQHHRAGDLEGPNPTQFQKTLGLNDFYYGHDRSPLNEWEFRSATSRWSASPMGCRSRRRGCRASCNGCRRGRSTTSPGTRSISG